MLALPATQTVETGKRSLSFTLPSNFTPPHARSYVTLPPRCRPSPILLNCGVPKEVTANALRLSVGRGTTRKDVDDVLEDLKEAVLLLEKNQLKDLK